MTDNNQFFVTHKNSYLIYDNYFLTIFRTDNIETGAADIYSRQADWLFTELKVSQNTFVSNYFFFFYLKITMRIDKASFFLTSNQLCVVFQCVVWFSFCSCIALQAR